MGPDALDWQNLFGPSKNLDKICLCQIFNLVIVGALKNFFFRSCRANCKICTVFTPDKNLSCSKARRRRLWSLVMLDKIWWEKNSPGALVSRKWWQIFSQNRQKLPSASGPFTLYQYLHNADMATSGDSFVSACSKTETLDPWNPGTPEHLITPEYQT